MKLKMFENFDDANESNIYADPSIKIEKIEHDAFGSPYVHIIHKNNELIGFVYSKPDQDYWNAVPANQMKTYSIYSTRNAYLETENHQLLVTEIRDGKKYTSTVFESPDLNRVKSKKKYYEALNSLSAEEFLDGISGDVEGTTADTFEEAVHELLP